MATKRSYAYLIGKFITNTIRSISGNDVGDLVASAAIRTGILVFNTATVNTLAATPQQLTCTGAAFNPVTGGLSIASGAMNLPLSGLYQCNYRVECIPASAAVISIMLYADTGSGYALLPFSAATTDTAGNDAVSIAANYLVNATVDNTKVALYLKTTAAETLNSTTAFATFISLPVVES